jgi:hypothetical protein
LVVAKKSGYVTITPIAETAAMRSQPRTELRQPAITAATETARPPIPSGIISRPIKWEWVANQT